MTLYLGLVHANFLNCPDRDEFAAEAKETAHTATDAEIESLLSSTW